MTHVVWSTDLVPEPYTLRPAGPEYCPFAEALDTWATEQVREALYNPTRISINRAILLVTMKYREWLVHLPASHDPHKPCIFEAWDEACKKLESVLMMLIPLPLEEPQLPKLSRKRDKPPPADARTPIEKALGEYER